MLMKRVKYLRRLHKETQQDVASILGITRAAYTNFEIERRSPDIDIVKQLAAHYNVSTDYLISGIAGSFCEKFVEAVKSFDIDFRKAAEATKIPPERFTEYINGALPTAKERKKLNLYIGEIADAGSNYFEEDSKGKKTHAASVTDDDLKVALFGGSGEVTDDMWDEVKKFAEFIKQNKTK